MGKNVPLCQRARPRAAGRDHRGGPASLPDPIPSQWHPSCPLPPAPSHRPQRCFQAPP